MMVTTKWVSALWVFYSLAVCSRSSVRQSRNLAQMVGLFCTIPLLCLAQSQVPAQTESADANQEQEGSELITDSKDVSTANQSVCRYEKDKAPDMVIIPPGKFLMENDKGESLEAPAHEVTIKEAFALGRCEVTVAEFREFVESVGHVTDAEKAGGCRTFNKSSLAIQIEGSSWKNPLPEINSRDEEDTRFDHHPVTCVSFNDAKAYVAWLNGRLKTTTYHLPSEEEMEYALRHGGDDYLQWPADDQPCKWFNARDLSFGEIVVLATNSSYECDDGYAFTAPVATFPPNPFGLYDIFGNVYELTEECGDENSSDAVEKGFVVMEENSGGCDTRVLRGGSWMDVTLAVRAPNLIKANIEEGASFAGFRLARSLSLPE